jgi:hypothetical protein
MMGFVPTKKLTFFLESFGNKSSELQGMDYFIHLGIIYIIQNRYQLDATAGYLYSYQNQWMDELYKKNIIFAQFVFLPI